MQEAISKIRTDEEEPELWPMAETRRHEMGTGGLCVCPKCGEKTAHRRGIPCQEERCPGCGAKLLRVGSFHHRLFEKKQAEKRRKNAGQSENEPP